jgi:hypothetical protein
VNQSSEEWGRYFFRSSDIGGIMIFYAKNEVRMGIMLLDVTNVTALPDYTLLLEFENGEKRHFSMARYMDQLPWLRIKAVHLFQSASVANGTVVWPGNIDIDPETLYEFSES